MFAKSFKPLNDYRYESFKLVIEHRLFKKGIDLSTTNDEILEFYILANNSLWNSIPYDERDGNLLLTNIFGGTCLFKDFFIMSVKLLLPKLNVEINKLKKEIENLCLKK